MAMSRSLKECGSDEARDDDDDPDLCSHCATDGKLQPALYFCFNCGVYGRYICGFCLKQHNRFVKNHEIEQIANRSACNRLDYENKKTMKVEKDLKSKEAEVMLLEEQVNEYSKVNQCHQERIKDLETACQNLEKEKNQGEKMATRNLEHLQNILKDKTKTAADEYKNLLAKMDNLQDRAQENDLKVKSLQHSNEELHKENAALLTELKQVKSENENLSKELNGCEKVLAVEGEKFDHKTKIQECERDTKRKGSKLIFKGKDDSYTGYSRQGEIADGKLHSGDVRTIENKLVVVAIEIGSNGSCYAFSSQQDYKRDPLCIYRKEWKTRTWEICDKTRSVVLFDENKKFHSFGFEADEAYEKLAENGEHHKWFYFNNFTMKLRGRDITRDFEIDDAKGRKMKAIDVFGAVIKYLKDHLLELLKKRTEVQNKDIHWVLTVPAIWTDSAKQFMREAAYKADIDGSQLSIALEPEAASLYCQMIPKDKIYGSEGGKFAVASPGTKYMVIYSEKQMSSSQYQYQVSGATGGGGSSSCGTVLGSDKKYMLLVAAIDFGTTFSGYAFSLTHEYQADPSKVSTNQNWVAGSMALVSLKAPTVVLFDENKKFHSFGYEAENTYSELALDGEHHKWYFFKRFKMRLHEKKITRNIEIDDDKGRKMKAIDVFGAVIRYLKDHLLDLLKTRGTEVQNKDIHWVLTVPAIWTDSAKQFMREAAYLAGISEAQLTIVSEPKAVVYYQMENPIWKLTTANKSSPGTNKCMVIDIGGNTADFTILERQSDGGLSEIKSATGIACGENMVIEEFHELLRNITGDAVYQKWIVDGHPGDQTDLQNEIESKTRTLKTYSTGKVTFRFPVSLPNTFKEINHESTRQAIEKSQYKGRIIWLPDKIRIDADIVKNLFKPCTDRIVDHVQHLLKEPDVQGTSIFLMVGMFSESSIVQEAIIKAFPTVNVIIPEEPSTVVLKGAVIYGHQH